MKLTRRFRQAAGVTGAVLATAPVASFAAGYNGQLFHPSHDGSGVFTSWGGEPLPMWETHVGIFVDHARHPVVLKTGDDDFAMLVRASTQTELGAMIGLPLDVEVGAALPFTSQDVVNPLGADGQNGVNPTGIGDARFIGKWAAFRSTNRYVPQLAFVAEVTAPTGDEESWRGAGVAEPSLMAAGQQNIGPVSLIANLGYKLHPAPKEKVWGVQVKDEVLYKLGAIVNTGLYGVDVLAEINGANSTVGGVNPLEAGLGVRRSVWGGVSALAGVNRGVTDSLGTPRWRYFAGAQWEWGRKSLRSVSNTPAPIIAAPAPTPVPKGLALAPTPIPTAKPVATPAPAPVARVTQTNIEINQTIHFKKNSAVIEDSSFAILDLVVLQLKAHPEIVKLSIEGHTDSTGNALFNLYLSKVRANSVRSYMTNKGVEPGRLSTSGWGHEKPMADNRTHEGRSLNRRVEFKIEKRKDVK